MVAKFREKKFMQENWKLLKWRPLESHANTDKTSTNKLNLADLREKNEESSTANERTERAMGAMPP